MNECQQCYGHPQIRGVSLGGVFLKFLQINSVCGLGSTGRIALNINNILQQKGMEGFIGYGRDTALKSENIIRIGNKLDNYIHGGLTRIFDTHGLWGSRSATLKFIKQIKVINPDVIHLHNIHGYYINIKILFDYLRESEKPVIWTLHDCWSFTGHCAYFDYVGCDRWKTGCYDCPQKEGYPRSVCFDNSKQNYKRKKELFTSLNNMTIVTPSQWLADLVQKSYLNKYPVIVIRNGIDLNMFKPTASDFRESYGLKDKFIILGIANGWGERKGFKYFLELANKLDNNYMIVIVGLTNEQKGELPKGIVGITRTNNVTELAEIYTAADVFVNPTLEDNLPTTNIEALACGTPVITFDTGGSVECVDDSCGIIVEKGNMSRLIEAIKQIKKRGYSTECCQKRASLFNLTIMSSEYEKLYSGLKQKV